MKKFLLISLITTALVSSNALANDNTKSVNTLEQTYYANSKKSSQILGNNSDKNLTLNSDNNPKKTKKSRKKNKSKNSSENQIIAPQGSSNEVTPNQASNTQTGNTQPSVQMTNQPPSNQTEQNSQSSLPPSAPTNDKNGDSTNNSSSTNPQINLVAPAVNSNTPATPATQGNQNDQIPTPPPSQNNIAPKNDQGSPTPPTQGPSASSSIKLYAAANEQATPVDTTLQNSSESTTQASTTTPPSSTDTNSVPTGSTQPTTIQPGIASNTTDVTAQQNLVIKPTGLIFTGQNAAAYLQLSNQTPSTITINSVAVPGVEGQGCTATINKKVITPDGVATTAKMDKLTINPGQNLDFTKENLNIMLMGCAQTPKAGDKFTLVFTFEGGGTQSFLLEVTKPE